MPPKPWETSTANKASINTGEIASGTNFNSTNPTNNSLALPNNSTNALDSAFGGDTGLNGNDSLMGTNSYNSGMSSYNRGYGSGLGGYGSSYGGLGGYGSSYGGGYGSSYGGYGGGYGSSYGGYGGGYGGSMFNRMGMGGPGQQGNFMEFALRYLDSFSYAVGSLCEMTRNIEMNAEGLSRFWGSFKNLLVRFFGWIVGTFKGGKELLFKAINFVKEKLFNKAFMSGLIFSGEGNRTKAYNILLRFFLATLTLSIVAPLIKLKA